MVTRKNGTHELWLKLKGIYQSKGPARKATLLKQLILKKADKDDVREHLNNFIDIVDKLADMGVSLHPDLLSIMMLYSLPVAYENFRIAVETRDTLPSPEELKIKIIEESEARKNMDCKENEEAFFTKKGKYCQKCKKKGHTTQACWGQRKNAAKNSKHVKTPEKNFNVCLNTGKEVTNKNMWCLDSGCTSHLCGKSLLFNSMTSASGNLKLASNKYTATIEGKGKVTMFKEKEKFNLNDTLFIPDLTTNLLSVSKITEKGNKVIFEKEKAFIMENDGTVILTAKKSNDLYYLEFDESNETAKYTRTTGNDSKIMQWHRKLGHINEKDLVRMAKEELMYGLDVGEGKLDNCETCIKGKLSRLPFPRHEEIYTTQPLQIIHSDVCGPLEYESIAGSKYYVTFIDDYTRYCCIYFIAQKSEVFEKFKEFKSKVESFTDLKIKNLQSDNGKEYVNKIFDDYLKQHGIQRRLSTPYTPQQNGISERKNRSLMDKARCLMIEANTPKQLWAEAVYTANYLINRSPSKALKGESPFKKWVGRTPSGNHLHIFGSKAFVLKKRRKGKLSAKATPGVFMGYAQNAKGFRIYIPEKNSVIISRDVKIINKMFYEREENYDNFVEKSGQTPEKEKQKKNLSTQINIEINKNEEKSKTSQENKSPESTPNIIPGTYFDEASSDEEQENFVDAPETITRERPKRNIKQPTWMKDYDIQGVSEECQLSSEIAYSCDDNDQTEDWSDAIRSEIRSHIKNNTWKIVKKEEGMKIIDYKMILKKKVSPENKVTNKARLVAKGFTQRPGVDYSETYAPVAKLSSIRTIFGIAVEEGLHLNQMDVVTAYLNGNIEETIYMKLPDYIEKYVREILVAEFESDDLTVYNKAKEVLTDLKSIEGEKVFLLLKAIYGLKQAGRQWHIKLDTELKNIGFQATKVEPCVYTYTEGGVRAIIGIYVDDMLLACSCQKKMKEIKEMLSQKFEMKDLGKPKCILGLDVSYKNKEIIIKQTKKIDEALRTFKMEECKSTTTPIEPGIALESNKKVLVDLPYKNLIGKLMFLAVATRPDIAFAVSYLSQFNDCFDETHFKTAKRVLRYLKGTRDIGLNFKKTGNKLYGMADADWGSCKIDRKSFSGYCFKFAGAPISWACRKQRSTALSTAEAEYVALTEAVKEAAYLRALFNEMNIKQEKILILNDNQAAIKLCQNPIVSSKSKHIDLKMHYIRDCIKEGVVEVQYQPTEDMEADLLTKGLTGPRLARLRTSMGIH